MDRQRDSRGRANRTSGGGRSARGALVLSGMLMVVAWLVGAVPAGAISYATPSPTATPATTAPPAVTATPAPPASLVLESRSTALGAVLAGPTGRTLYTLSSDPANGSICTGQCLAFWPPLVVAAGGTTTAPSGTNGTFATFVRSDTGATQVTLSGRALYYFKNDTGPGQTNGEGIQALGGVWHAVKGAVASATGVPGATTPPTSTAIGGTSGDDPLPFVLILVAALGVLSLAWGRVAHRRGR